MEIPENTIAARARSIVRSIRSSPYPLRRFNSLVLRRTGLSRFATIPQDGFRLRFYPTSLSAHLWTNPHDRQGDVDFLNAYLRPGDIVVDAGANIGLLTLAAARCVQPAGHVIAIEPHPRTFGYLQGNLRANPDLATVVSAFNAALGERDGRTSFSSASQDDQNHVVVQGGLPVPMRRLDTLARPFGRIALLKIDVEGYELFALQGALETLPRVDAVYFESYAPFFAANGYALNDVLDLLAATGFTTYQHDGQSWRRVDRGRPPEGIANLLALRHPEEYARRTGQSIA